MDFLQFNKIKSSLRKFFLPDLQGVSRSRILELKNTYRGERAFIIGNGPSLNEYTFGLNRIYLMFDELGFKTNFLVSVNQLLLKQCAEEINRLKIPKFISSFASDYISLDRNTVFIKSLGDPQFSTDLTRGIWEGATVTYVAMQVAYYLGFSEVILIGVDHNFKTKGTPHKIVEQRKDDPNHFSPKYFKGMKWQLPDLPTSELAYRLSRYQFESDGRKIVDATVGGKLKVFPKVKYEELFKVHNQISTQ